MFSLANYAIQSANPILPSWIDVLWWVIPIAYLALVIWAIVELVRNKSLDIAPKLAFAFLIILAPFIGSILTILLVRSHANSSAHRQPQGEPQGRR